MTPTYGRQAFMALIEDDAESIAGRWIIDDFGVHLRKADNWQRNLLDAVEISALNKHPTGNFDEPALPFPFTIAQLLAFERTANVVADRYVLADDTIAGQCVADRLDGEARVLLASLLHALDGTTNSVLPSPECESPRATNQPGSIEPSLRSAPDVRPTDRWRLEKPKRGDSVTHAIYLYLRKADKTCPVPSAGTMLLDWREERPPDLLKVNDWGVDFSRQNGRDDSANVPAIQARINRMIKKIPTEQP